MSKGKNNKLKEHAQLLAAKLGADQQSNGALEDGFQYLCKSSGARLPPIGGSRSGIKHCLLQYLLSFRQIF